VRKVGPGQSKVLGLLGLARRAGAVSPGVEATRRSLGTGEVRLVLLATDASETQLEKVRGLIRRRGVPVRHVAARDALGKALGRGRLSVVGVTTRSFATQLLEQLPPSEQGSRA
jgi:ribosomal protein L7Ae-like RNA K-turn-binding protein